jgi:hypothetical protein
MKSPLQQGLIINPRGVSGSGKTELVRRLIGASGRCEAIYRNGRHLPIAYRLEHPFGGRPVVVVGDYTKKCGGCDTIPERDGGLDEIFRLASECSSRGSNVILEGLTVSSEHRRSIKLAEIQPMCVLLLSTPLEKAAKNLVARRHLRRATLPIVANDLVTQAKAIELACEKLRSDARVERLGFDSALRRIRELLDLPTSRMSGQSEPIWWASRSSARGMLDSVLRS